MVGPWVSPHHDSDFAVLGVWTSGEIIEVQCVDSDGLVEENAIGLVRALNAPRLGHMVQVLWT